MPARDDPLRSALRDLADQAGPATFAAEPLVRRAGRLRARFATIGVCCGLVVAGAAVSVPAVIRSPAQPAASAAGPASPSPSPSPWGAAFACGQPVPSTLPGSATAGFRMAVGPVTRTSSGAPAVTWSLNGTWTGGAGPVLGPTRAVVLLVRDGRVVAVQPGAQPEVRAIIPAVGVTVPKNDVQRYQPRFVACAPRDWDALWADEADYRVVIVATVWTAPGQTMDPRFLSAAAALTSG
jgi:hypothetical protein